MKKGRTVMHALGAILLIVLPAVVATAGRSDDSKHRVFCANGKVGDRAAHARTGEERPRLERLRAGRV